MALLATIVVLAACGGSDDGEGSSPTVTEPIAAETTEPSGTDSTQPSAGDYTEGPVGYRVVNVLDRPVDIYVRTSGLIEAWEVQLGVQSGQVTEYAFPPVDGRLIITEADGGDPTCVNACDHFIAELSSSNEGNERTIVVYDDPFDGPSTFDVWENPGPDAMGNANSMPNPDPAAGIVVPIAVALTDADFGFQLAFAGVAGCQIPSNDSGILVGGNQTPPFAYDGDQVDVVLHGNQDRECVEPAEGGPFPVAGGAGTRTLLVLTGSPGSMDALAVALSDGGDSGASPPTDDLTESAIAQLAEDIVIELGITEEQARCVSELMVAAVDPADIVEADGTLREIEELDPADQAVMTDALVGSVTACGLDPAVFG